MAAKGLDKRVYDVRATDGAQTCVVSVSADSTLLDLHLALLAVFDWQGDYGVEERGAYRLEFRRDARVYTEGRGSRTRLRRVLSAGTQFTCAAEDPKMSLDCEVIAAYEVRSRRHHPKALDVGGSEFDARAATWRAQSAVRREFRGAVPDQPLSPEYVHGMFAAVVSGPLVMPSAWLPEILHPSQYRTLVEVQRAGAAVMDAYNAVAGQIHRAPERFIEETARLLDVDTDGTALEDWVRGYIHGMALAGEAWKEVLSDTKFRRLFTPIAAVMEMYSAPAKRAWLADAELRSNLTQACPIAAVEIAALWRTRFQMAPRD
jgi:yecA family protein